MEDANIEEIIEVLERIEKEDLAEDPDIKGWLEQITSEEFQLIEPFITMFIENMKDEDLTDAVMKVLRYFNKILLKNFRKLNYYQEQSVLPQILKYKEFPKNLVKFIGNRDRKKISGDSIGLFNDVYRKELYIELIDKEFLETFFECFDLLNREKDLNKSVQLISEFNQNENLSKIVLSVFKTHKNSQRLVDYLLFLLNMQTGENKQIIFNICKLISDLLDITQTSLFYRNDLDSFISICIKTLESTYTNELRYHFLNILNKILSYKDYFESKYKIDILEEILENYQYNENVDEINQKLSGEILQKIEKNS